MKIKIEFIKFNIVFLLLLSFTFNIFCSQQYRKEVVFSLQYGNKEKDINIYIPEPSKEDEYACGPTGFWVDDKDNIYIADASYLKKYDAFGFLEMISDIIPGLKHICVDDYGFIYSINGPTILKINPQGKVEKTITRYFNFKSGKFTNRTYTEEGHAIQVLFDKRIDKNSNIYEYKDPNNDFILQITVYDLKGKVVKTFKLNIFDSEKNLLADYSEWIGTSGLMVDGDGNIYHIGYLKAKNKYDSFLISPYYETMIYKYNNNGDFITSIGPLPQQPFSANGPIPSTIVTKNGDIYHVEFHKDRMRIIKYTTAESKTSFQDKEISEISSSIISK